MNKNLLFLNRPDSSWFEEKRKIVNVIIFCLVWQGTEICMYMLRYFMHVECLTFLFCYVQYIYPIPKIQIIYILMPSNFVFHHMIITSFYQYIIILCTYICGYKSLFYQHNILFSYVHINAVNTALVLAMHKY